MKRLTLVLSTSLLLGLGSQALAQVQDVSFTISPVAGYTHWDKKLNLGDSPFWGVRAGFGFGPLFEIRGIYERSFDLKGKLRGDSNPSWIRNWGDKLEDSKAEIERIGGELKLNLWSNAVVTPYLTAGGGVMKFSYTGQDATTSADTKYKEEQIYGAGGVGLKFNLGQRVALSLEGKDLIFNVNENNRYLTSPEKGGKQLHNWTGQVSLDIYFGGNTDRPTDAISRAYRDMYTDGFRGIKFAIEPGVAYVDFAKNSGLADQWFVGGSAGVDFSSVFGIRGFYYGATEKPQTLNLQFNKNLKMYGGNFIARLNMPLGVTPSLNLGAGYLDVSRRYAAEDAAVKPKSGLFLFGGGGLEIPLHRYVALYGSVNAMLTQQDNPDIKEVTDPSDVNIGVFYQAGVRFNIGRSSRNGYKLYQQYSEARVQSEVERLQQANLQDLNDLRAKYESRVKKLNNELADAVSRRDTVTVTRVLREKEAVKSQIDTVEHRTTALAVAPQQARSVVAQEKTITLTQAQLDSLIARVVADVRKEKGQPVSSADINASNLSELDKILLLTTLQRNQNQQPQPRQEARALEAQPAQPAQQQPQPAQQQAQKELDTAQVDSNIALAKRLDQVIDRLNALDKNQQNTARATSAAITDLRQNNREVRRSDRDGYVVVTDRDDKNRLYAQEVRVRRDSDPFFHFNRASVFAGPNLGDHFTFDLGLRAYLQMRDSKFDLVPDAYVGFIGSDMSYGINANVVYNLPRLLQDRFTPYLGVGVGFNSIDGRNRFLPNYVVGTSLNNVLGGNLFVDYTVRGLFRNNQLAVGYRFSF